MSGADGWEPWGPSVIEALGKVHALVGLMLVIAQVHPDPAQMLRELDRMDQSMTARTEATPVPEAYLDGQRDVVQKMRTTLQQRLAPPEARNSPGQEP